MPERRAPLVLIPEYFGCLVFDRRTSRYLPFDAETTGLLSTAEIAKEFGKRELVWLNVSLEGATAATNDAVRGEGTYAKVMDRLAVLRRHSRFTLAFTI